jgi:hypothetical protein
MRSLRHNRRNAEGTSPATDLIRNNIPAAFPEELHLDSSFLPE